MGPKQLYGLGTNKSSKLCNFFISLKQQSIETISNKHCEKLRFTWLRLNRKHFYELQFLKLHTQWIFIYRHTIFVWPCLALYWRTFIISRESILSCSILYWRTFTTPRESIWFCRTLYWRKFILQQIVSIIDWKHEL